MIEQSDSIMMKDTSNLLYEVSNGNVRANFGRDWESASYKGNNLQDAIRLMDRMGWVMKRVKYRYLPYVGEYD